jgi:hypothetical protein
MRIASRYPGSKPISQLLTATDDDGKAYDVITVQTLAGVKLDMWFDISAMYRLDVPSDYHWKGSERMWMEVRQFWLTPSTSPLGYK